MHSTDRFRCNAIGNNYIFCKTTQNTHLPFRTQSGNRSYRGERVPYYGFVEVRLKIPHIKKFNEDILLLVTDDSPYGDRVPVTLGTLHIARGLELISPEEEEQLNLTWTHTKMSMLLTMKKAPAQVKPEGEEDLFNLDQVKGNLKLTKPVVIPPFAMVHCQTLGNVRGHRKRINIITKDPDKRFSGSIEVPSSYTHLKPGSRRVSVSLKNLSCKPVRLTAKTVIAKMAAANVVPPKLAPKEDPNMDENPEDKTEKVAANTINSERENKTPPMSSERLEKLMEKIDLSGVKEWSEEQQIKAKDLITEFSSLFALDDMELGKTSVVRHKIKLTDYTPFKERYQKIPPTQYEEVRKHLQEMLDIGAIRKSSSPWASAVVLVTKKDGSLRFCIDLCKLNNRTVKDSYALPRIEETLECLSGAKWFTSLDLKSGYWQVEMSEECKEMTAFTVGPLGFYECERMPFGLCNAPATFQRLMEMCLGELHLSWCIIYLDDIIIFSKTPEEHLERLRGVFEKLAEAGLKLKTKKCEFFKQRIAYLSHIVSEDGIEVDPKKVEAIKSWETPKTVTDVRSFLGFTNGYRKFIKGFAQVARPLSKLTAGDNASKKKTAIVWDAECEYAFLEMKRLCTTTPVLAYADYSKPFILNTDASGLGLGAVLSQEQDDKTVRPVAFASRCLSRSKDNYPAHKLEFLALKWAVCDRFHEYLYGGQFDVYTDNNPLTYVLTTAKLDACGHRWIANLANYNFNLHYKPGKTNVEADALSRIPWQRDQGETLPDQVVKAIMTGVTAEVPFTETYFANEPIKSETDPIIMKSEHVYPNQKPSTSDWKEKQTADENIGILYDLVKTKKVHTRKGSPQDFPELRSMLRNKSQFVVRNELLYRKTKKTARDVNTLQFVLPKEDRKQAMTCCHEDIGHLGVERSLDLLRDRFYGPNMAEDNNDHIKRCERCLNSKQNHKWLK